MVSEELQKKLDYYEQVFYALDTPIPFKGNLELHPILVKDYFNFYSSYNCITMDKTTKEIQNPETGRIEKVVDIEGISQSYLAYLARKMREPESGQSLNLRFMQLLELVFHVQKGLYCPECGAELTYQEAYSIVSRYEKESIFLAKKTFCMTKAQLLGDEEEVQNITEIDEGINNLSDIPEEILAIEFKYEMPEELKQKVFSRARLEALNRFTVCGECGGTMRDTFSILTKGDSAYLVIKDVEITSSEFDEFRAIVPRQNILDYEDDKYVDPELKEELKIKAEMQNRDYTSPTLEKQLVCVSIGTGLSLESLHNITMRKLSMYLKLVDKKEQYYAQYQASMSGMVSFKEDPKHWIFSNDKKNIKDELTNLDDFTKKFDQVT